MRSIRQNVFETNSSSTHSLTFTGSYNRNIYISYLKMDI